MRPAGDEVLYTIATDCLAARVETRERRKCRLGAHVAVWRIDAWKMDAHRSDIGGAELHIAKIVVQTRCECGDISVAKIAVNPRDAWQLHLVSRSQRGNVAGPTVQINDCIRRYRR